jgi:hypothetical protein
VISELALDMDVPYVCSWMYYPVYIYIAMGQPPVRVILPNINESVASDLILNPNRACVKKAENIKDTHTYKHGICPKFLSLH